VLLLLAALGAPLALLRMLAFHSVPGGAGSSTVQWGDALGRVHPHERSVPRGQCYMVGASVVVRKWSWEAQPPVHEHTHGCTLIVPFDPRPIAVGAAHEDDVRRIRDVPDVMGQVPAKTAAHSDCCSGVERSADDAADGCSGWVHDKHSRHDDGDRITRGPCVDGGRCH
jgi:hypothetical protein